MDHIIPLKRGEFDLTNDWYRMHVLLAHRLGPRVAEDGSTRWTFAVHPKATDNDAVLVRTQTADAEAAARAFAPRSLETYVPAPGDRIDFSVSCSGRTARPSLAQTLKERVAYRQDGIRLHASKIEGNFSAHLDHLAHLLARCGLADLEFEDIRDHRYFIRKTARQMERGIGIVGIISSGRATVSDIELLRSALQSGVGRDKGFGFGVLLVQPPASMEAAA